MEGEGRAISTPAATVLIPTFDHGPLVRLALESALVQTVTGLEVFLIGDGVPDVTREIGAELSARDPRLRFFDNPKGPRNGEIHRHAALAEARGRIVLYLADDDLWLPDHVEAMLATLAHADFAMAPALVVTPDGVLLAKGHDFGRSEIRRAFLRGRAGITLSALGHTLAAYRRLPEGWTTTPNGIATDRYLWQQFVSDRGFRGAGTSKVTVLSFASSHRVQMSLSERFDEMSDWWDRVCDAEGRAEIQVAAFAAAHKRVTRLAAKLEKLELKLAKARRRSLKLERRLATLTANREHARPGFRLGWLRRR